MQENLKKKYELSDDEYKDAIKIVAQSLSDNVTINNVSAILAIAELLSTGDIESEENDDKD